MKTLDCCDVIGQHHTTASQSVRIGAIRSEASLKRRDVHEWATMTSCRIRIRTLPAMLAHTTRRCGIDGPRWTKANQPRLLGEIGPALPCASSLRRCKSRRIPPDFPFSEGATVVGAKRCCQEQLASEWMDGGRCCQEVSHRHARRHSNWALSICRSRISRLHANRSASLTRSERLFASLMRLGRALHTTNVTTRASKTQAIGLTCQHSGWLAI